MNIYTCFFLLASICFKKATMEGIHIILVVYYRSVIVFVIYTIVLLKTKQNPFEFEAYKPNWMLVSFRSVLG